MHTHVHGAESRFLPYAEPVSLEVPGRLIEEGAAEAPPGGTASYRFLSAPGTYLYQSPSAGGRQIAMGLYGALIVRSGTPNQAYDDASTAYDSEAVLVLSALDPALNADPGGFSMLEGSSEVRFPVRGKLGAVAFVDYGNVWAESWHIDPSDLRYAIGPGLRYATPIGPARFDFGYQVNPIPNLLVNGEPQKHPWRLHFSVGQAF